jgi:hypothetical protein
MPSGARWHQPKVSVRIYDGWPGHRWSVVRLPLRLSRHGLYSTFGSFNVRSATVFCLCLSEEALRCILCLAVLTAACSKSIRPTVDTALPYSAGH